jgi:hypothetical protein
VSGSGLVIRRLLVVAVGVVERDTMLEDSVGGGWLADGKVSHAVGGDRRDDRADADGADRCEALAATGGDDARADRHEALAATGGDDVWADRRDGLADASLEEERDTLVD